ncbi:MAG TPA: undecaprenyl-phosphate glucose phosphotransferase [Bacteroidales bacterium]|nr:undecaprenyl-phosphate glucose phosphotransferase [Bacteroidales bacterium]HRZ48710.1 undecaprenyl-phosphate glucose phosphotransferase [Bacteroidales bacterium]
MPYRYSRYIPLLSLAGDFVLLNLMLVIGFIWHNGLAHSTEPYHFTFYLYLNLVWVILVFIFRAHTVDRNMRPRVFFITYVQIIIFFFFFFLMFFQVRAFQYYPRDWWKYIFPAFFLVLITWKMLLYYGFMIYRRLGYNYRNVIIIGNDPNARALQHYFISNPWHGLRYQGYFSDREIVDDESRVSFIGTLPELDAHLKSQRIDEVFIAWSSIPRARLNEIFEVLDNYPVKVRVIPDLQDFSFRSAEIVNYGDLPVIQIHPGPLSIWYNRVVKRVFDVVVSLLAIVLVLSWLTPILWIASLLGSREGVFFRQRRTAADGREFTCLKYRSMRSNPEADEKAASKDDKRITPVGRFLRKTSLDEFPQFFNVLRGEMSVVGPRPHMLKHTEEYRRLIKRFMLRHTVKPGITGLAQVRGYRGEITCVEDIAKRVEYDVKYIENWSFNLDLRIILRTLLVLFKGQEKAY